MEVFDWPWAPPCQSTSWAVTPEHPGTSHSAAGLRAARLNARQSADHMVNIDVTCLDCTQKLITRQQMIRMTHYTADISLYLRSTSHTGMWKANNLFIEGIPLCVDCLQVILKLLGAGAFGSSLYQTLAKRVDVLELRLQWINVVFLERLKPNGTSQHYYFVSAQITMGSVLFVNLKKREILMMQQFY